MSVRHRISEDSVVWFAGNSSVRGWGRRFSSSIKVVLSYIEKLCTNQSNTKAKVEGMAQW